MIYLRTYMYVPHEVDLIIANLEECYEYIDKMIICEFDIHNTGEKRDFQFQHLKSMVPAHLRNKIDYHACEVFDLTSRAYDDEKTILKINEPVMRSYFTNLYAFSDDDIIISVDADEILYGETIPYVLDQVESNGTVALKMRQFFWKPTYIWKNKIFRLGIATKYGSIPVKFPSDWRDIGILTDDFVGGHFSWCMDIDAMIHKLHTYGHPRYRFCAEKTLLETAIQNKEYPFDPNVAFDIEELAIDDSRIPKSISRRLRNIVPESNDISYSADTEQKIPLPSREGMRKDLKQMSVISIVYTNSEYSDAMGVFEQQYRRHCDIPLYKISDYQSDHIYSNNEPYYRHWIEALENIREDYFIYNQDDFFLYADVNSQKIYELVDMLDDSDWSYIRLIKSGINLSTSKPDLGAENLYIIGDASHPQYAMQATIWKKQKFMEMYAKAAQAKWFECEEYNKVCRQLNIAGLYYYSGEGKRGRNHYDSTIYPYVATAIVGGQWNLGEYPSELSKILKEYQIDPCDRGIYL